MKTTILSLCFLGFLSLGFSQNNLAMVEPSSTKSTTIKTNKTAHNYEMLTSEQIVSEKIQKLQRIVSNYDIKSNDIYSGTKPGTYTVNFKEGNNEITAIYDQNGKVLESSQMYENVRLPYVISSKLAKNYPGWEFSKVNCEIIYTNQNTDVIYKVVLKMNRQKKTVTLNASDYLM